nr:chain-length determining protein [uncultured Prevotella sp.]
MEQNKDIIDLTEIYQQLKKKKKVFFIVLPIVFALSCLWIFPEPRFYKCDVTLAPEMTGEDLGSGLASVASQFGVNVGGGGTDAIYPTLYPDVMNSNEFIINLLKIKIKTLDGSISTDYYTYMTKHQKNNWLKQPFKKIMGGIASVFIKKDTLQSKSKGTAMNAFQMSKKDYDLVQGLKQKITCNVDKKTEVITISVQDQDPLVSAIMADSVRQHLQNFIIQYRTNKARIDVQHYSKLTKDAKKEYDASVIKYSSFCDANQDVQLQSFMSKRDELENEMQLKFNTYSALRTQLEAMKAKLQEKTPAFTTLQNATVPVLPAGPKRMIFVIGMCIMATFVTAFWLTRKSLFKTTKKEEATK